MSDRGKPGQKDFFPLLEGKSNWDEWKQHLEVLMNAKHSSLLKIITGVERRPEEIVAAAAAIEAMIKEDTETAVQEAHNTTSRSLNTTGPGDNVSPSATSTTTFTTKSEKYQTEWDVNNKMALAYLASTVNDGMSHHIGERKTAHEVYESLREACEVGTPLSSCLKSIRWSTYKYEAGKSFVDFLNKWQYYLAELQQAYPADQQVPPLFCFHTFISAVSHNPACVPWLNTLSLDGKGYHEHELDVLYNKFWAAESRRLGLDRERTDTSTATHSSSFRDIAFRDANSNNMRKDESYCAIHKRTGHSTKDCYSNPKKKANRRNRNRPHQYGSNHSKSQTTSPDTSQKKTPINSAEERKFHAYLSDEDDEPCATDLLRMAHP